MRSRRAFTLLEVMVSVTILALALTAIFSSQVGAIRVAHRARTTSIGTMLARCKMAEVEEFVAKEGLPAVSKEETDECCEDAEVEGYSCTWKIERIVLPSPAGDAVTNDLGEPAGDNPTTSALSSGDPIAAFAAGGSLASGGFGSLILSYAFPILKPSFEEQVRRATVTVRWKEGTHDESFDVVQYLVDASGPALAHEGDPGAEGAAGDEAPLPPAGGGGTDRGAGR